MGNAAVRGRSGDNPTAAPGPPPITTPTSLGAALIMPAAVNGVVASPVRASNPNIAPNGEPPAPGSDDGNSVRLATEGSSNRRKKNIREKNRFGSVIVKVASLSSTRRAQERQNVFTILGRGGLFYGTQCNPILVQDGEGMVGAAERKEVLLVL